MGLDSMRGSYGRCPPILVGALFVICVILMFNWWSLSAQNYDLIKQMDDLSEQLRISSEEQERCARQRSAFENQVKSLEEESAQLRVKHERERTDTEEYRKQLAAKDDEIKSISKTRDDCQATSNRCSTELESLKKLGISKDSVIASLRLEKDQMNTQLDKYRHETQESQQKLKEARAAIERFKEAEKIAQPAIAPTGKSPAAVISPGHSPLSRTDMAEAEDDHAAERIDEVNGDPEDVQAPALDERIDMHGEEEANVKKIGTEMYTSAAAAAK